MLKFLIVVLLLALIVSLFSGFYFLMTDQGDKEKRRTLNSLGVRVTLAVSLIAESVVQRSGDATLRVLGHLAISGIITALVLRYFYVQQRLRLQEQAELQSRIQALQSRIRPHFSQGGA